MKFLHDKDGRQLLVKDESELVCGRCKNAKNKEWYYYKPFDNIYCKKCAMFPGFGLFNHKKAFQEPFIKIDVIGHLRNNDHLIIKEDKE
jgi:late competence protein required for DNA uptake (superfamily II DNA/RNA helicase)